MARWKTFWILLLPLVLSGCMMGASAESLYALPQLPDEYEALNARLTEILSSGAEYAPPQAGANLPPVQMVDLDGDGTDEALAFFRLSSEERPLKIYIFRAVGDRYEQAAVIDGSGTSIHSFLYQDMNGDGIQELIVSWSVSAEVQAMSVYMLENLEPVQMMSTSYARYTLVDLDGDDHQELVVLRSDDADTGQCLADYYIWDAGNSSLRLQSTARLSVSVAAIQWMQVGALEGGEAAVFVTGRTTVEDVPFSVTDILVFRQELTNIVLGGDTGVSTQVYRSMNLPPADMDGDGATEVPIPAELLSDSEEEAYWKIYWNSYHLDGTGQVKAATYHNLSDGWYLLIPEEWDGHFTVRQNNTSTSVRSTTFYSLQGRSPGEELLTIYTLTGTDREVQAAKSGRAILRRRTAADTVYAVSYGAGYDGWQYAVEHQVIAGSFNVIVNQWSMGEN